MKEERTAMAEADTYQVYGLQIIYSTTKSAPLICYSVNEVVVF